MGIVVAVSAALLVGFLVGLLTFKLKQSWCAECGATLACPADGTHHAIRLFEKETGPCRQPHDSRSSPDAPPARTYRSRPANNRDRS